MNTLRRVFVDLDGVVVDFEGYMKSTGLTGEEVKARHGAYLEMLPIPGAIEAVRSIIGMGYEVWIATKPPTGIPHAYAEKAAWVLEHLPELKRRIIMTHDKGLLGDHGDFLLDDRPHKANCERFKGTLLSFNKHYHWPEALEHFRRIEKRRKSSTLDAWVVHKPSMKNTAPYICNQDFRSWNERGVVAAQANRIMLIGGQWRDDDGVVYVAQEGEK